MKRGKPNNPNNKPTPAARERQKRLRDRRKAEGWRRITVWLSPEQVATLKTLGGDTWLGTTVKELLERGATTRRTPAQTALFDAPGPLSDSGGDVSGTVKKDASGLSLCDKKGQAAFMTPEDKTALMAEVDSLLSQGLSGGEIARRFNEAGRRTIRGAAFTGRNVIRDWRTWKVEK